MKKKRESPSHFRYVNSEYLHCHSIPKNGEFRESPKSHLASNVGYQSRYHRCVSKSANQCLISEVFLFHFQWDSIHVPASPFWVDNGSLGLFTGHETNQILPKAQGSECKLVHRRLFNLSSHECPDQITHYPDKEC